MSMLGSAASITDLMYIVFLFQQQLLECNTIPVTMPSQNTDEHMVLDDAHWQPLYSDSSGQAIPLNQLEMATHAITSFSTEFTSDWYQQQSNPSDGPLSPPVPPLVCCNSSHCITKYLYSLYHRLLPLILYKSHVMIRVMWLFWVPLAMMMKWNVRNSLWFSSEWSMTCSVCMYFPGVRIFTVLSRI